MENNLETTIAYWGYIGIMAKKMETTLNPKPGVIPGSFPPPPAKKARDENPCVNLIANSKFSGTVVKPPFQISWFLGFIIR